MDTIDFAWVVGLYEGEGTCYLTKNGEGKRTQRLAFVAIQMADNEPLERAMSITGLGKITGPYVPSRSNAISRTPLYYWRVCSQIQVVTFLEAAWPMLSQRRRTQAEPVLQWCKTRLAERASGQRYYTEASSF